MKLKLTLLHPLTGTRVTTDYDWSPEFVNADDVSGLDFYFREGNLSCDCNRSDFFPESERFDISADGEVVCGHSIVLERLELPNGVALIINDECQATYQRGYIVDAERFLEGL